VIWSRHLDIKCCVASRDSTVPAQRVSGLPVLRQGRVRQKARTEPYVLLSKHTALPLLKLYLGNTLGG